MKSLVVRPASCRPFGSADGSTFCLVTNSALMDRFRIEDTRAYRQSIVVTFDQGDSFEQIIEKAIPEPAHVLVVSPEAFFQSPLPERIGRRKLMVMACNSTPTSMDAIEFFLQVVERTDPYQQQEFADRFFAAAQGSEHLRFVNDSFQTSAIFEHLNELYDWNQQAGPLEWGQQQLAPSGEISVLPTEILRFDPTLRLPIHGEIAFQGQPVLHAGTASYLREDQARIYGALDCLGSHAVIATVANGVVSRLRPVNAEAQVAVHMLEAMFDVDSRYRIIWEVGFGINTAHGSLLPGNHAMNEIFGSTNGVVHWGLGLTPHTQYALILPSFGTRVCSATGDSLMGTDDKPSKRRMIRRTVGGCVCHS